MLFTKNHLNLVQIGGAYLTVIVMLISSFPQRTNASNNTRIEIANKCPEPEASIPRRRKLKPWDSPPTAMRSLHRYQANPRSEDNYILKQLQKEGIDYTKDPYRAVYVMLEVLSQYDPFAVTTGLNDATEMFLRGYKDPMSLSFSPPSSLTRNPLIDNMLNGPEARYFRDKEKGILGPRFPEGLIFPAIQRLAYYMDRKHREIGGGKVKITFLKPIKIPYMSKKQLEERQREQAKKAMNLVNNIFLGQKTSPSQQEPVPRGDLEYSEEDKFGLGGGCKP